MTRRNWADVGVGHSGASPGPDFVSISEIDGWRSKGHEMAPPPDRAAVMKRIEVEVERLIGALDEGTDRAVDGLIESWVAQWLATEDAAYIDACSIVDVHYGRAAQIAVTADSDLDFATTELHRLQAEHDHLAAALAGFGKEIR
ncbi:hypothetical protein ACWEP5_36535 [Nocardia niigatensis]